MSTVTDSPQMKLQRISNIKNTQLLKVSKVFGQMLSYMESNIRKQFRSFSLLAICGASQKSKFLVTKQFQNAFHNLSLNQKLDLFQKSVNYGRQIISEQETIQQIEKKIEGQMDDILPSGKIEFYITLHEGFRSGQEIKVKVQGFKISSKGIFSMDLQNYILRKSKKKSPQCFVLQAINDSHPQLIRFSFANNVEKLQYITVLQKIIDLALKNVIKNTARRSQTISPRKIRSLDKQIPSTMRQSYGVNANLKHYQNNQSPTEFVSDSQFQSAGQSVIQFSRHLAEQKKKQKTSQKTLLGQLLQSKKKIQQNKKQAIEQAEQAHNIYNKVLEQQQDVKVTSFSQNQPLDKPKQNKFLALKHYKNVFQIMFPDFNLRELNNVVDFTNIHTQSSLRILQHKNKPNRYRAIINVDSSLKKIYSLLLDCQKLRKWNPKVDESSIKLTLTSENCLICYQKHKRYNQWFKERDFLFLRHAFTLKGQSYIADKSIQHSSFIPFHSIQRGNIRHSIIRLKQVQDGKTQLLMDIFLDYRGLIGQEKKKLLTVEYLKGLQNLQQYLKEIQRNKIQIPTYCDLDWNVDWTIVSQNMKSISFRSQEFNQGSQFDDFAFGNIEEQDISINQSQYYSVAQNQDGQFQAPTKQTALRPDMAKKNQQQQFQISKDQKTKKRPKQLQSPSQQQQHEQCPQIQKLSIQSKNQKILKNLQWQEQIVLNEDGFCVLDYQYLTKKHIMHPINHTGVLIQPDYKNIVLKNDFVQDKDGGIRLVNKAKIQAQDNVFSFIMKTMKKNLFSGKSILSISLPVQIFRQDSNTQRLCECMTQGPRLLQKAAQTNDPLERMKWAIAFALSNSLLYFYMEKPFNPILGQTYQGMIDGCPIYAEQISHHPPITSLYFEGRGYRVSGSIESKVFLHLNSGDGINAGFYTIQFTDGQKIKFQTAPGQLSGFTMGDRKYRYKDRTYIVDVENCLYSQLFFQDPNAGFFSKGNWKYPDQIGGEVSRVSNTFVRKFINSQDKISPKPKDIEQTLAKIQGRWLHYIGFDGKKYYDIDEQLPFKMVNYPYALHSDAKFREDMIYRMKNDLAKSQTFKQLLENKQRRDRKLRSQYTGKKH